MATAAAKKTTAKKTIEVKATPEVAATRFLELRQRAIDAGRVDTKITNEPFVMGEDWGFSEDPITVTRFAFTEGETISNYVRGGASRTTILNLIFKTDFPRIVEMINALDDGEVFAAQAVAEMLIESIMEHFYGKGAAAVFPR